MSATVLLRLGDIRPGMVLAADVRDDQGNLLLNAGTVLSEVHLRSLGRRALRALSVAAPADERESERLQGATRARLEYLFRHSGPGDAWFKALIIAYRLGAGR